MLLRNLILAAPFPASLLPVKSTRYVRYSCSRHEQIRRKSDVSGRTRPHGIRLLGSGRRGKVKKAAIIGAGIGGLALAIRLQSARSEEHTSELQSLMRISSAVLCLKKTITRQTPS